MDLPDKRKLLKSLAAASSLVAFMWLVHFVFWMFAIDKTDFAIIPQKSFGLLGILTAPMIHADYIHLFSNSGPMLMFLTATIFFYPKVAARAMVGIWLITGIWVWILANTAAHMGASGVVYGLGAFLFFSGVFRRDVQSIVVSLLMALLYGSMVVGIFPGQEGISWQSHLFGVISGTVMAFYFRKVDVPAPKRYHWQDEAEEDPHDAHAPWNYRENWPGAQNLYTPGEPESGEQG